MKNISDKNFKEWFGDSKVIDENGNPLVVYHGTNSDFSKFKPSKSVGTHNEIDQIEGIYFTDNKEGANWYALVENDPRFLKSVYLYMKNPYYADNYNQLKEELKIDKLKQVKNRLINLGHDGLIMNKGFYSGGGPFKLYLVFEPDQIKIINTKNFTFSESKLINRNMKKLVQESLDEFIINDKTWLNEVYLEDIPKETIISKKFDDNVKEYIHNNLEDYAYAYKYEVGLEDKEDEEIIESEDFKLWIENEIENKYDDAVSRLEDIPRENGKIRIWREIAVDKNWFEHFKKEGKRLGIYWSFDRNAAEAHWGYNQDGKNIYAKIEAIVDEKYIDWVDTIKCNLNFYTGEEEKEIRLFKNTPIKIEKLWINLEEQDISAIKNKIFKA